MHVKIYTESFHIYSKTFKLQDGGLGVLKGPGFVKLLTLKYRSALHATLVELEHR